MAGSFSTSLETPKASASGLKYDKRIVGSGPGSSDNDSLASEVGRLSEENAHLSRKISEMLGKTPATSPSATRSGSLSYHGGSSERGSRDNVRKLEKDNRRLIEQNSTLERRLASTKTSASTDEIWRLKEENRSLRVENSNLSSEIEQLNKVASYVGNRVAKVLVGARRANNYNSQLVGELKRWNRRLEDENHRLYNIIDRLQNTRPGSDMANAVVSEASALSSYHERGRNGNAKLVKQLEDQNVKLQEEISKLSDHAISLQNLSSSSGSSGSSGILPAPRTPSNHEQDGPGLRRNQIPDQEAHKVAEKLRGIEVERRKSRNMSADSLTSDTAEDMERLRNENKRYAEEIERIGTDLAFVRTQITLSQELKDSNAAKSQEIQKLTEAATRMASLEEANASQAVEIERLLDAQTKLEEEAQAARELRDDNAQMEEDIFKLADEVERLQASAITASEFEGKVAAYQQELADLRATQATSANTELDRLKQDNIEVQRTLEALAAEKAVLQAQVRELLEERARLQSQNKELDFRARQLQEKANEAKALRTEVTGLKAIRGQSATYRSQISSLRNENEQLASKASDLAAQLLLLQGTQTSGLARGQNPVEEFSELEVLRSENVGLTQNLEALRKECRELQAKLESLERSLAEKPDHSSELQELTTLREENRELSDKCASAVLLTVQLTTLRNQVSDFQKMEQQFEELQATLKQLRAEKICLQKEANAIPALKGEMASLLTKVQQAEAAQKSAEADLAGLASSSEEKHNSLMAEHQKQSQRVVALERDHSSISAELEARDVQLSAIQTENKRAKEEHTLRSQQSLKNFRGAESRISVLEMHLEQEKSRFLGVSKEAAELHSLLETAKAERTSQQLAIKHLQQENNHLSTRIAALSYSNRQHEKLPVAGCQSNGHAEAVSSASAQSNGETSMRPTTPASLMETAVSDKPFRNARSSGSSEEGWGTPQSVSPLSQMQHKYESSQLADAKISIAATAAIPKDRKASAKRFAGFFKLPGNKKRAANSPDGASTPESAAAAAATIEPRQDSTTLNTLAEETVLNMYEKHVDSDDIDGFMAALGFSGFAGPTAADDMEGAFASAKYACRPEGLKPGSDWEGRLARATFELLEAWQAAWLGSSDEVV